MSLPKTKAQSPSPSPSVEALPLLDRGISTQNPDRLTVSVSDSEQSGERATLIAARSDNGTSTTDTNINIDMDIDIEAQQEQRQQHQQQPQRQSKRPKQSSKSGNIKSDGCGCGCLAAIFGAIFGVVAVISVVMVLLVCVCNVCGVDSSGKKGDTLTNVGFVQSQTSIKEKSTRDSRQQQVDQDIVGMTSNDHTELNPVSNQATGQAGNQQSSIAKGDQKEDEDAPQEVENPIENGRSSVFVITKPSGLKPTSTKNQQKQKEKTKHNQNNTRLSSSKNGRGAEGKRVKPKSTRNGTTIDNGSGLKGNNTSKGTGLIDTQRATKKTPSQIQQKLENTKSKGKQDAEDKKTGTSITKVVNGSQGLTELGNGKLQQTQQAFITSGSRQTQIQNGNGRGKHQQEHENQENKTNDLLLQEDDDDYDELKIDGGSVVEEKQNEEKKEQEELTQQQQEKQLETSQASKSKKISTNKTQVKGAGQKQGKTLQQGKLQKFDDLQVSWLSDYQPVELKQGASVNFKDSTIKVVFESNKASIAEYVIKMADIIFIFFKKEETFIDRASQQRNVLELVCDLRDEQGKIISGKSKTVQVRNLYQNGNSDFMGFLNALETGLTLKDLESGMWLGLQQEILQSDNAQFEQEVYVRK